MVEVMDFKSKVKMLAMIMCSIEYHNDKYVVYCIDRGRGDANIFVSKLVMTSEGYIFNNVFDNGEKNVLDGVIKRIINKEDIVSDGFKLSNDIKFEGTNDFRVDECYVSTISKKNIKDIMIFYKLVTKDMLNRPVVNVVSDKRFFNEGFLGNIFLIIFGVAVIIFCIVAIVGVFK